MRLLCRPSTPCPYHISVGSKQNRINRLVFSAGAAQCNGREEAQLSGGRCGCQDHSGSAEGFPGHVSPCLLPAAYPQPC